MTTDELMALADECATSFFKFVRYGHDIEYGERYEAARTALRSALEAAVGEREPLTEEQIIELKRHARPADAAQSWGGSLAFARAIEAAHGISSKGDV